MKPAVARWVLVALVAVFSGAVDAQQVTSGSDPISAKERAALFPGIESIQEGQALASRHCAKCHGLDGISPDKDLPDLAGQRTLYLYREMLGYQDGQRSNPDMREAIAFLDSDALLKTAIYFASLPPPYNRERAADAEAIEAAMDDDPLMAVRSAVAGCGSCHGADGNASIPGMPHLTGQSPEFFVSVMQEYRAGDRLDNMMQSLSSSLDDETLARMGLYFALQVPVGTAASAPGNAQRGGELAESCAGCHGVDGNPTAPDTPTLAGQDPTYFVRSLNAYVDGKRDHAAMQGAAAALDESAMQDLAAFYATQKPNQRVVRKPLTAREWLARCSRCHGIDGNSTDPRSARLSGQNETYLVQTLQSYADGERPNSVMHAMSAPLSRGIIERLAAWYTIQEPRSVVYFDLPCEDD